MEDERFLGEQLEEGFEIRACQRVEDVIFPVDGQLDEADFFIVMVEAVGLHVDGDPGSGFHFCNEVPDAGVGVDVKERVLGLRSQMVNNLSSIGSQPFRRSDLFVALLRD